jgi:hypothetical protein
MKFSSLFTSVVFSSSAPVLCAALSCRCTYGDECWPHTSQFTHLASQVSQPLIHPVPPASVCYPGSHLVGDCFTAKSNRYNGTWRSHQPGSMQFPNFETYTCHNDTEACYMDASLGFPCEQGSVPVVGVDARSVNDVQIAVKFAAKHNLRLVVKNTG